MTLDRDALFKNSRSFSSNILGESVAERTVRQSQKDSSQDSLINELMKENDQLKGYLASLLNLLIKKDVISMSEVVEFTKRVESGE